MNKLHPNTILEEVKTYFWVCTNCGAENTVPFDENPKVGEEIGCKSCDHYSNITGIIPYEH